MPAPTLVLVHGGATNSRFWDRLVPHLGGAVLAVDLPGRGSRPADPMSLTIEDCARSVVADLDAAGATEVVVVAHSSGGLVVPGVVERLGSRRVRAIVLNAASVPPEGGSGLDCMKPRHRDGVVAAMESARAEGRTITTPIPERESLRDASGERLDEEQLAFMADPDRLVADSMNLYFQPVRWSATAGVPATYVVNLHDRPVPVELQREMAARLPGPTRVVEVDAGHYAAVTRPAELAAIIRTAARGAVAGALDN